MVHDDYKLQRNVRKWSQTTKTAPSQDNTYLRLDSTTTQKPANA